MNSIASSIAEFFNSYAGLIGAGIIDTCLMVFLSTFIAYLFGIALGVILYITDEHSLCPQRIWHGLLAWIVNISRSIPFIILLVAVMPVTRGLVGTTTGVVGVIPPLVLSATPFIARMIEQSLNEIDRLCIEAAQACGASLGRIIFSVLLPESLPSIVRGVSISLITVLGYAAIVGAVGAGGLGDIAIRYGYYRYEDQVMFATIILMVIIVQIIQTTCDFIAVRIDRR
ncbi:methionine ABC transporter permease [Atopobium deltae]|uniref:Putative D-methionine transport system permease protein MetI n=1 Tax=Atopobium deltae TaxID=1393034 RepID=A0A133XUV6_9ACTN|nr:methionine ABC transporter permease [Atopobium deltae]KXB34707.1 putative D-methionine transport system permease protein MetI [Atopobium deltae]